MALTRRARSVGQCYSFAEKLVLIAHWVIYLVISIVLITGVLMMDRPITVFDLFFIPQPLNDPYWIGLFFIVHIWSCAVLALLVAVHVAAVFRHEVVGHRVLKRMLWSASK